VIVSTVTREPPVPKQNCALIHVVGGESVQDSLNSNASVSTDSVAIVALNMLNHLAHMLAVDSEPAMTTRQSVNAFQVSGLLIVPWDSCRLFVGIVSMESASMPTKHIVQAASVMKGGEATTVM